MYTVYILYSPTSEIYYKGHTADLDRRLKEHASGRISFTAKHVPWELVWSTKKRTKSEAYMLERKLKKLNKSRLLQFIDKYKGEP